MQIDGETKWTRAVHAVDATLDQRLAITGEKTFVVSDQHHAKIENSMVASSAIEQGRIPMILKEQQQT
jgi:hypothetical protein